ncbi:hypothetical protein [Streptomyces sp. NRRL S-350]|uniref:hypothetical protein n=1 Tax=Streptomyces sp. NRRL S-350 TaxID=1463902 RepID=UPI0004BE74C3|nr:hypothetical protein [Streptomyces sp. NRRL S-350]
MDLATAAGQADALAVWCGAVAAVCAVAGILWRATRALHHAARNVEDFVRDWAGNDEHPGVIHRLDTIEDTINRIDHELHPNSGGSLRDAVDRVDKRTQHLDGT